MADFIPGPVRDPMDQLEALTGVRPTAGLVGCRQWRITHVNARVRMAYDFKTTGPGRWHDVGNPTLIVDGQRRPLARDVHHYAAIFKDPDNPEAEAPASEPAPAAAILEPMPPLRSLETASAEVRQYHDLLAGKLAGEHPTSSGRSSAAYDPGRATLHTTRTTLRRTHVGPLSPGEPATRTVTELAWAAGMFEGEGSVRISTRTVRNNGALLVDMVNVQPEVTAFLLERWGGIRKHVEVPPPRRRYWRWRLSARQAVAFLAQITPYLRTPVYRQRAALAIEYQAQKSTDRKVNGSVGYAAEQDRYFLAMKRLNVRGCEAAASEVQP